MQLPVHGFLPAGTVCRFRAAAFGWVLQAHDSRALRGASGTHPNGCRWRYLLFSGGLPQCRLPLLPVQVNQACRLEDDPVGAYELDMECIEERPRIGPEGLKKPERRA